MPRRSRTTRRLTVVLATTTLAAMTGCTVTEQMGDRPPDRPSPTFGPAAELAHAARALQRTSFTVKLTVRSDQGTSTLNGTLDAQAKTGTFTATTRGPGDDRTETGWRILNTTLYAKTTINGTPSSVQRPWQRLRNEPTNTQARSLDVVGMAQALTKATAVQRSDPQRFTGILDGTTANSALHLPTSTAMGTADGASAPAATSVAFTADLDDRRRLAGCRATITPSTGGSITATVSFTDFGTRVTVQPPPPGRITGTTVVLNRAGLLGECGHGAVESASAVRPTSPRWVSHCR